MATLITMKTGILPIVGALLLLAGCESYYRPLNAVGGYDEVFMANGAMMVQFKAPNSKDWEYLEDMCRLRAAELCWNRGYIGFKVAKVDYKRASEKVEGMEDNVDTNTKTEYQRISRSDYTRKYRIVTMEIEPIEVGGEIPDVPNVYDVAETIRQLRARHRVNVK